MRKRGWLICGGVAAAGVALVMACSGGSSSKQQSIINEGPDCVGGRTPGFWCENQDGQNPNLSVMEFEALAAEAAMILSALPELDTAEEIADAVCGITSGVECDNNEDQLLRHLAAVALNLAANLIDEDSPLFGEVYGTVGEAVDAAIAAANDPLATWEDDCEDIKDVLEGINEDTNVVLGDECGPPTPDAGVPDAAPDAPPPPDAGAPDAEEPDAPPPPDAAPPEPDAGDEEDPANDEQG